MTSLLDVRMIEEVFYLRTSSRLLWQLLWNESWWSEHTIFSFGSIILLRFFILTVDFLSWCVLMRQFGLIQRTIDKWWRTHWFGLDTQTLSLPQASFTICNSTFALLAISSIFINWAFLLYQEWFYAILLYLRIT